MREGCVELCDVEAGRSRLLSGELRRVRLGQVPKAGLVGLDAVIDTADPHRVRAARHGVGRRDHDGVGAVGDGWAIVLVKRFDQIGLGQQLLYFEVALELGIWIVQRVLAAADRDLGHLALGVVALVEPGSCLQCRHADGVDPERSERVRIELHVQGLRQRAHRRPSEREGEGGVAHAGLDLDPGFVEGPGAVHLHMGFGDRRPGAQPVDGSHEGEGLAGEVVGAARAGEADVGLREARLLNGVRHHGKDHLDLGALGLASLVGRLGERKDGDVAHQYQSPISSVGTSGSSIGRK